MLAAVRRSWIIQTVFLNLFFPRYLVVDALVGAQCLDTHTFYSTCPLVETESSNSSSMTLKWVVKPPFVLELSGWRVFKPHALSKKKRL